MADQALGEDGAVGAGDLDRVVGAEVPAGRDDAGREQGRAPFDQGPPGPVVDHDRSRGADGEGDPQLAGREPALPGPEPGAHPGSNR